MTTYEIDFKDVKEYEEFYQKIIKSMNFPSWCGENPDAIWDMVSTHIEIPAIIYLKGLDDLPRELQEEKELILEVFADAREWYKKLRMHVDIIIE